MLPAAPIAADVPNATLTVGNFPGISVSGASSATLNSRKSSPDVTLVAIREVPVPSPAVAEFVASPLTSPINPKANVVDEADDACPDALVLSAPLELVLV